MRGITTREVRSFDGDDDSDTVASVTALVTDSRNRTIV